MDRPYGYDGSYDEDKHNIAGGDQGQLYREDQQHEKKSVLRKVKDKAKKLKDNITHKHGHGHDSQAPPSEEFEGYEDEDEEMDEDAEIHGAPIYDSHQSATSQGFIPRKSQAEGTTFSRSQPTAEERLYAPMTTPVAGGISHAGGLGYQTKANNGLDTILVPEEASRSFIPGQVGVSQHAEGLTFGGSQTPHNSVITPAEQQHQHSPEALLGYGAPQEHIFVMKNRTPHPSPMAGVGDAGADHGWTSNLNQAQDPSSLGAALERPHSLEEDPRGPGRVHEPENYQSKVTDPTGMGGEEIGVTGATPVLQALNKMNIYDEAPTSEQQVPRQTKGAGQQQESLFKHEQHGQGHQALHTGSHNQFLPEPPISIETTGPEHKGLQSKDATSRTEHDQVHEAGSKQGSTYMDKVSSATSVIVDKAAQAKNVVASKLGYGYGYEGGYGQTADTTTNPREAAVGEREGEAVGKTATSSVVGEGEADLEGKSAISSVGEYGKKVASTVYEKVAGAGSVVMSKVKVSPDEKDSHQTQESAKLKAPADIGVSVKEYIVEKISPGEEDKALSEVITGAFPLHSSKEGRQSKVEDAQKVDPEGRVTLSASVARRLGGGGDEKHSGSTTDTSGTGVVDKIKEAATGWFGKGGETQPLTTAFHDTSHKESDRTQGTASGETRTGEQRGRQ